MTHHHGGHPDAPDPRDIWYHRTTFAMEDRRNITTLPFQGSKLPPRLLQGPYESCGGNALAALLYMEHYRASDHRPELASRMGIYYGARKLGRSFPFDGGMAIRDGLRYLTKHGVPTEERFPYVSDNLEYGPFEFEAPYTRPLTYLRLRHEDAIDATDCLDAGHSFVFLMEVFAADYTAPGGVLVMPAEGESAADRHIITAVDYDSVNGVRFLNWWDPPWGDDIGAGWMPWDRFAKHCSCGWTVRGLRE